MTQQAPQSQQAQPARAKTVDDLTREIFHEAGIEGIEVSGIPKAVWFAGPWTNNPEGTDIRHGEPLPMNPALVVYRTFEDPNEIRVYCLALSKTGGEGKATEVPSCYKLNKATRVYTVHTMSLSLFRGEVADELKMLANVIEDDEPDFDVVECPACHVEVPELPYCGSCGTKLPETVEGAAETNGTPPAMPGAVP